MKRPAGQPAADVRRVEAVSAADERDQGPRPGRLDPAPRAVQLLAVDDPALRVRESALAAGPEGPTPVPREGPVTDEARSALAWNRPEVELVARPLGRQLPDRAVVHDDRERDHRLSRPAAEVVDRERHAWPEEDELGRQLRDLLPGPEPEEREPDAREDPRAADAAARHTERRAAASRGSSAREPCQAESRVRLERRGQVGLASPVDRPQAVGALAGEELVHTFPGRLLVAEAEELEQEQVLRGHGHVGLELAHPPAVRLLQLEEAPVARPSVRSSSFATGLPVVFGRAPGGTRVVTLSRHSARHARALVTLESGWREGCPSRSLTLALRAGRERETGRRRGRSESRPPWSPASPLPSTRPPGRRRPAGLGARPARVGPGEGGEGGRRLAAHARPEELGRPQARGQLAGQEVDELAAALLAAARAHRSRRPSGTGPLSGGARSALPGRRPSARRFRAAPPPRTREAAVEEEVGADDRRVLELGSGSPRRLRALGGR